MPTFIQTQRSSFALLIAAAVLQALLVCRPAVAQNAYWSLQGETENATDSVQVFFDLAGNGVSSSEIFYGATWGHSGTLGNAVGDPIDPGGFDPILSLFEVLGPGAEILRGQNDDGYASPNLDSLLTWPALSQNGGSINTDPLTAGDYRMSLTAYQLNYPGGMSPWAMDLLGPWVPMTVTGIAPTGGASIQSLKFGSGPSGGEAWVSLDAAVTPSVTINRLVVGTDGAGRLFVNEGTTLTTGISTVGGDGEGYATVSGPGAVWNTSFLFAGDQLADGTGSGHVTIENQGHLTSGLTAVGTMFGNGSIVVSGSSASWDVGGRPGLASLAIGAIGFGSGSVNITQGGSLSVSSEVSIGESMNTTGALTVQSGGHVTVGGALRVFDRGTVELLDGEIHTGSFIVDPQGTFTHEDGTLTVDGGQFTIRTGTHAIDGGAGGGLPTIRLENGAVGTVEPDLGASVIQGSIYVGGNGPGRIEVVGGSRLTTSIGRIGSGATTGAGSALLQGDQTLWELTADIGTGTPDTLSLAVGAGGSAGTLEVRDGAQVVAQTDVSVGNFAGAQASVLVDGPGSRIQLVGVPGLPSGFGNGRFSAAGANASVTIANFATLDVHETLQVTDGASLVLTGDGEIITGSFFAQSGGTFTHDDGTLTVDGGTFDPGTAGYTISGAAAGDEPTLELINGATAAFTSATPEIVQIGATGDAALRVIGNGSRFEAAHGIMDIGWIASGRLEVLEGGRVDHTGTFVFNLGVAPGTSGFVTVDGPGSQLSTGGLMIVGDHGEGNLGVTGGGRVTASRMWIAHFSDAQPSNVLVSGEGGNPSSASSLEINGSLYVSGNDSEGSSGVDATMSVTAGGDLSVLDTLKVWAEGTVRLDDAGYVFAGNVDLAGGRLEGNGSIVVGTGFRNAGTIAPGLSAGSLAISGSDYVQDSAGTLEIEIGGTSPTQYDRLVVITGAAMLGGTLDVSLIDPTGGNNAFQPALGDKFEIITAQNGVSGPFDNQSIPSLSGNLALRTFYTNAAVTLAAVPARAGDYNINGAVDAPDYSVWRSELGGTGVGLAADGDLDADVDGDDFDVWHTNLDPGSSIKVLFSEDFYGVVPGTYGGEIPGAQFQVAAANVDVVGVRNGSFFSCDRVASGNCLDLVGNLSAGAIMSVPTFDLTAGATYFLDVGVDLQGFADADPAQSQFSVSLGSLSQTLTANPAGGDYRLTFTPTTDEAGARLTFAILSAPDTVHGAVLDHIVLFTSNLPGDYNKNGVVDAADYIVWRNTLGQTGPGLAADGNGDQTVDQLDYGIWTANFGATVGSSVAAHAAVPEPNAALLILVATCVAADHRRRINCEKSSRPA